MLYEDIENKIETSDKLRLDFKEYRFTGLNVKTEILEINNFELVAYVKENEFLDQEMINRFYGDNVNTLNLHYYPYLRLVIANPEDIGVDKKLYVLHLNKASFTAGLQELELYETKNTIQSLGGINPWIQ